MLMAKKHGIDLQHTNKECQGSFHYLHALSDSMRGQSICACKGWRYRSFSLRHLLQLMKLRRCMLAGVTQLSPYLPESLNTGMPGQLETCPYAAG